MRDTYHSLRVEAVVLRHSDYGEADRILTLYTRQLGKTRTIVKGAAQAYLAQSRTSRTVHARQASTRHRTRPVHRLAGRYVDAYLPLREDLLLTGHASYVIELLDRFTYEDNLEHPTLFRLLTETLVASRF